MLSIASNRNQNLLGAIFIPKNKEEKIMSEKAKAIHTAYCDYEVAKAKSPSRIYSVRSEV